MLQRRSRSRGRVLLSVVSISALLVTVLPGQAFAYTFSSGGTGTTLDPYKISSCADLQGIGDDLTANYVLTADVDCSGTAFTSIGLGSIFTGTLNGANHAIGGISINTPISNKVGIFSEMGTGAEVKNLSLFGGSVIGHDNVGAIAGAMQGNAKITNVYSTVEITASNNGAGLVGSMQGTASVTKGAVLADINGPGYTYGGIVGYTFGSTTTTLTDVYYKGDILISSANYVGGLVGFAGHLSITRGYAAGSLSGDSGVGGIAGSIMNGTITGTFAANEITAGIPTDKGPIAGAVISSTLTGNYFDANITGFISSTDGTPVANSAQFYDKTLAPLSTWNFSTTWSEEYNDYPALKGIHEPYMLCEQPTSTDTTASMHCLVTPRGWGIPTWEMRYRKSSDSTWTSFTQADIHEARTTLTGLTPGTNYDIGFRYTNDFGTGPWGMVQITTTGTAPQLVVNNTTSNPIVTPAPVTAAVSTLSVVTKKALSSAASFGTATSETPVTAETTFTEPESLLKPPADALRNAPAQISSVASQSQPKSKTASYLVGGLLGLILVVLFTLALSSNGPKPKKSFK